MIKDKNVCINGAKPSDIKSENRRTVLKLVKDHGLTTVRDISLVTGMSRTTALKTMDSLCKKGFIISGGKGDSTYEGGKKPELYIFNANFGYSLCVDISADAMEVAIFSMSPKDEESCRIGLSQSMSAKSKADNVMVACRLLTEKYEISMEDIICVVIANDDEAQGKEMAKILSEQFVGTVRVLTGKRVKFAAVSEAKDLPEGQTAVCALITGAVTDGYMVCRENTDMGKPVHTHQIIDMNSSLACPVCGNEGCFACLCAPKNAFPDGDIASVFECANVGDKKAQKKAEKVVRIFAAYIYDLSLLLNVSSFAIYGDYSDAGDFFYYELRKLLTEMSGGRSINVYAAPVSLPKSVLLGAGKYACESYFADDEAYI